MTRQELSNLIKQNLFSYSWHVQERMRERKLNRVDVINTLKYGLLRIEEDNKMVVSHGQLSCVIAKNSIGVTVCSAWRR